MKTRQDNDLTECMGEVYIEKYTKLLGLIELGVVYEKQDKTTM